MFYVIVILILLNFAETLGVYLFGSFFVKAGVTVYRFSFRVDERTALEDGLVELKEGKYLVSGNTLIFRSRHVFRIGEQYSNLASRGIAVVDEPRSLCTVKIKISLLAIPTYVLMGLYLVYSFSDVFLLFIGLGAVMVFLGIAISVEIERVAALEKEIQKLFQMKKMPKT